MKRIFLDIGAHKGETLRGALLFAFDEIHCFEPASENWPHLTSDDPRVTLHRFGLSKAAGQLPLWRGQNAGDPALGSFGSSLYRDKRNVGDAHEMVALVRASDIVRALDPATNLILMKINVEGAECDILEDLLDAGLYGAIRGAMIYFDAKKVPSLAEREQVVRQRLAGFSRWVEGDLMPKDTVTGRTIRFIAGTGLIPRLQPAPAPAASAPGHEPPAAPAAPPAPAPRPASDGLPGVITFAWPLRAEQKPLADAESYSINHVEKLRHLRRLAPAGTRFDLISERDWWSAPAPAGLFADQTVLASIPAPQSFAPGCLEAWCAALIGARRLLLWNTGALALWTRREALQPLIDRADRIIGWCGRYWHQRFLARSDAFAAAVAPRLRWILPAIHAADFAFRPRYKPQPALFHASVLSAAKHPPLLFASLPENARFYLGAYAFDGSQTRYDQSFNHHGVPSRLQFPTPGLGAFTGQTVPLMAEVTWDGVSLQRRFQAMGYIRNDHPGLAEFLHGTISHYIHTSRHEGLASTVMENGARGLLPCVTVESGLDAPSAVFLSQDPFANQTILSSLGAMTKAEYNARVQALRQFLEQHHSWDRAVDQILAVIREACGSQP